MLNNLQKTALFLLIPFVTFAQSYKVEGKLVDTNTTPIPFANVILVRVADEATVKGTITDENGKFIIEDIVADRYYLKISYLGFGSRQLTLNINKNINVGNIELASNQEELDEVVVIGRKPTIERKADRLVFNVENSTLSNGDTWQVLKNTPTLIEIGGSLRVKGREAPAIYINDRRVHLTADELQQLLQGTPASIIKSVEVISNPPAKYDAEGGAVVNIVTSRNIATGYNGSIFTNYARGNDNRATLGTNHYFKTNKANFFGSYSFSDRNYEANFIEDITFIENGNPSGNWKTNINQKTNRGGHTINANADFVLSQKQSLGFSVNISFNPDFERNTVSTTQAIDSTFVGTNRFLDDTHTTALNLNYDLDLNNEGQHLSANLYYINSSKEPNQMVSTTYTIPSPSNMYTNAFLNNSKQETSIYAGQLDFVFPKGEGVFETGIKATGIETNSLIDQTNQQGTTPAFNDEFNYTETNLAAYASYEQNWDKWNLKLGLRGENTSLEGESISTNQTNTQDYFQVFPTFFLQNQVTDNYGWNVQYSRRIERPNYKYLNPFRYYTSDNSFTVGNPELQPTTTNNIIFGNTFKDHTIEVYYSEAKDPTYEISFQDNQTKKLQYIFSNVEKNINYGIDYYSYFSITNKWSINTFLSYFYDEDQFLAVEDNNQLLKNGRWVGYVTLNNYFTFLKDNSLKADVFMYYMSPVSWGGTGTQSELKTVDVSLTKTFWNERASLTLQVTDLFNTFGDLRTTNNYLSQKHYKQAYYDEQSFGFRFRYKFGNYNLSTNQRGINLEEKERIN